MTSHLLLHDNTIHTVLNTCPGSHAQFENLEDKRCRLGPKVGPTALNLVFLASFQRQNANSTTVLYPKYTVVGETGSRTGTS